MPSPSIPVATIDTLIFPPRVSSKLEPKMMLASSSTSSLIRLAASSISNKVMSAPPVILINTPFAPCIEQSSNNGFARACSAALIALSSPSASPVPIMAFPLSSIIDLISAKSKLINPGIIIKSVIERTPAYNTLSAITKASTKVGFLSAILNKFWFGITMILSTSLVNSDNARSAVSYLFLPSNWNGFVTTPIVKIPLSFAIFATTGAAPDPVPPPMPAVMNTMFAPSSSRSISSRASSAANFPTSGLAPAPSPFVVSRPS